MGHQSNEMLTLPLSWILCCQQTILRMILPCLVSVQYSTSRFQKVVPPALCSGGGGVQSAALKTSLQAPFPCSGYVRTGMIGLPTFIACELLVSDFQSPTKKGRQSSAGVNLFLIKIYNLAPGVGVAVGFRQAAGLLLPI